MQVFRISVKLFKSNPTFLEEAFRLMAMSTRNRHHTTPVIPQKYKTTSVMSHRGYIGQELHTAGNKKDKHFGQSFIKVKTVTLISTR